MAYLAECLKIGWCETGQATLTTGGILPARYVIHTVGPITYLRAGIILCHILLVLSFS